MSTSTKISVFAAVALALPIVLVGATAGAIAALFGLGDTARPSQAAINDIPSDYQRRSARGGHPLVNLRR